MSNSKVNECISRASSSVRLYFGTACFELTASDSMLKCPQWER